MRRGALAKHAVIGDLLAGRASGVRQSVEPLGDVILSPVPERPAHAELVVGVRPPGDPVVGVLVVGRDCAAPRQPPAVITGGLAWRAPLAFGEVRPPAPVE